MSLGSEFNRLGATVAAFGKGHMTAKAVSRTKACIIDTVAATLAGIREADVKLLYETSTITMAQGDALIFGTKRRVSALDAVLTNGAASQALQAAPRIGKGGLPLPLVAALFALAETHKKTGEQIVAAYAVGVETACRLDDALGRTDNASGHIALLAIAAAAANLLQLDSAKASKALRIALSLPSQPTTATTQMPALQAGLIGRNGVLAAQLAEVGYSALDSIKFSSGSHVSSLADWSGALSIESGGVRLASSLKPGKAAGDIAAVEIDTVDIWERFDACAEPILARDQIAPLFERLETLDTASDVGKVTWLLQVHTGGLTRKAKVVFAPRGTHEPEETTWVP